MDREQLQDVVLVRDKVADAAGVGPEQHAQLDGRFDHPAIIADRSL